jgi:outer membrane biosynthesis protein TonB
VSLRIVRIGAAVVLSVSSAAFADRAIDVEVDGAPFAAGELAAAIRVRIPLAGPPLHVRVTAIAGGVHVEAPGGDRDVALRGRRGAEAARLVALAASDLLSPEPSIATPTTTPPPTTAPIPTPTPIPIPTTTPTPTPIPTPTPPPTPIPTPPPTPTPTARPATRTTARPAASRSIATTEPAATLTASSTTRGAPATDATAFAFYAGVAGWDNAIGGLTAELDVPLRTWVIAVDLGGGTSIDGPVQLVESEARAGIGRRIGPLEMRLDAVVEPLIVTTGAGDFTALFGGGASVRLRGAVGSAHLVAAAGIDAFANQTEYRTAGADALTTPRITPWLRVGVEVPL